jgi:PhoPQ-activated pathogenicity-related protein
VSRSLKRLFVPVVFLALVLPLESANKETALDRYVKAPDSNFKYSVVSRTSGEGVTQYVLDMTSQQYLSAAEVDRPLWQHWVTIVKPANVSTDIALLFIGGGNNPGKPPDRIDPVYADIAAASGAVVAELRMVPNQPLVFAGETRKRTEDAIIAYTWDKFLRTGDEKWPLRLPMTKAAVRAMDAVSAFLATPEGGGAKVARYVVSGGSKRGWTTWTTAAVDKRVIAIMPAVIDLLNIVPSFTHHYRGYGFWAPSVGDYLEAGIMDWVNTREYQKLMAIEEPFSYKDRLTMPKFLVNSSGDQFFLPDSSQFYFRQFKGEKYLRYVPNTDHAVTRNSDAIESMAAYFTSIVKGTRRPEFTWSIAKDGTISVKTKDKPSSVKLWQAHNPSARDFRLEKIGPAYKSSELQDQGGGRYATKAPPVQSGYAAYFVELTFPSGGKYPFKFTTDVKVMPDTYPFGPPAYQTPAGAHPLKK